LLTEIRREIITVILRVKEMERTRGISMGRTTAIYM
jgi:hypothetical protein